MAQRLKAVLKPGKSRYVSENRGLALLDEAIEQIELQNKADDGQWYQGEWRCNSGMCLAGWVSQLAGGQWLTPADHDSSDLLALEPEDDQHDVIKLEKEWDGIDGEGVSASERALRLLGLENQYVPEIDGGLFYGENTLPRIKRIRDWLAENVYANRD